MKLIKFALLILIVAACNNAKYSEGTPEPSILTGEPASADMKLMNAKPPGEESTDQSPATERKLIKNGSISFEVGDVDETQKKVAEFTAEVQGYISSDNASNYDNQKRHDQVIRIPAGKLDEFASKIEGLARKVDNKNISTQDVTEEFIDIESRLKTKKELEARYREILRQAKNVEEILLIESNLNTVRSDIESMEGRLKYLTSQVSMSTLTLSYYERSSVNSGFGYRFVSSFGEGWENLLAFVIGLISSWPFVIMIGVGIWLFVRYRRRKANAS